MIRRFLYWLRAKNRHGTHSPFIYRFLDETYYREKRQGLAPEYWLLKAAFLHFGPQNAAAPRGSVLASRLRTEARGLTWGRIPADLVVFDAPGESLNQWLGEPGGYHNDTVVFVGGLREGDGPEGWREALSAAAVRVSLRNYYAGLLFFRREQAPEHFRIRN